MIPETVYVLVVSDDVTGGTLLGVYSRVEDAKRAARIHRAALRLETSSEKWTKVLGTFDNPTCHLLGDPFVVAGRMVCYEAKEIRVDQRPQAHVFEAKPYGPSDIEAVYLHRERIAARWQRHR